MKQIQCANCNYIGPSKTITPGYRSVEIVLWLLFFPIGFVYSMWRLSKTYKACPGCGFNRVYNLVMQGIAYSSTDK